jgi:hypothetical protein
VPCDRELERELAQARARSFSPFSHGAPQRLGPVICSRGQLHSKAVAAEEKSTAVEIFAGRVGRQQRLRAVLELAFGELDGTWQ